MKVERGAVIDQPQLSMPHQHVGVARRAIDIARERIEPDDGRGEQRVWPIRDRIEGDRTR